MRKGGVISQEAKGHGAVFPQSKHRQRERRQVPVTNASQDRPLIYFPPSKRKKKRTHISLSPEIIIKRGRAKKNCKTMKRRKELGAKKKKGEKKISKNNDKSRVFAH